VPAGTRVLEVIIRFGEDPLAHHTLAPGEALVVGPTAGCDLIVSGDVVEAPTELVRVDNAGATVTAPMGSTATHVDADGRHSSAQGSGNAFHIDGRCGALLDLGSVSVELRWTIAAEQVGSRRRFDWRAQRGTAFSFGLHLLILVFVLAIPPTGYAITGNNQEINQRFLKILQMPKEQDVIPKWMRKRSGGGGKAAKAARGPSGKMGDKSAPKRRRRVAVKGNSPLTQPRGAVDPHTSGVLGLLSSARGQLAAILDPSKQAIGGDALTALGLLQAPKAGSAWAPGGLGVIGDGRSGGGCLGAHCGLVGTDGKLATIGGGPGYDGPAIGPGKGGGPGNHKPRVPKVWSDDPVCGAGGSGCALSKSLIRRYVRKHLNEVRYCYQREIGNNRSMNGRVVVRFLITRNGRVGSAVVKRSTLKNSNVESCLTQAVRRWAFPQPKGAGIVDVSYPFIFRTVAARR
jgi:TonB family protein